MHAFNLPNMVQQNWVEMLLIEICISDAKTEIHLFSLLPIYHNIFFLSFFHFIFVSNLSYSDLWSPSHSFFVYDLHFSFNLSKEEKTSLDVSSSFLLQSSIKFNLDAHDYELSNQDTFLLVLWTWQLQFKSLVVRIRIGWDLPNWFYF